MNKLKQKVCRILSSAIKNAYNEEINEKDIFDMLEKPKNDDMGDIAFPCFRLSKILKESPTVIADKISESLEKNIDEISEVKIVNAYINFFVNGNFIANKVLNEIITKKEEYGTMNIGEGKTVAIDYSSPNIAKPFHLGHLRTTIIGRALYNIYKNLGYNVIGINYLGDWGRQFGLVIEGYKRFKDEYDVEKDPLHSLSDMYTRISKIAKEDENVMNLARDNFKKLEEGDKEYLALWQYFREVSLKEYSRIYDIIGCKFDSYNGESFYNDKMDEVVEILDKKGVLVESEGAKVVNLSDNQPPCIILKSNGSTIYATRDLAAILWRSRNYDYEKSIYVTGYEQIGHFKQVFEVAKYLVDEKYTKGLVHVPYGMVRLKTGKMSTREGTVIYLQDLIGEAIKKAREIIDKKEDETIDKDVLSKQVGIGAIVFNDLKHNKIKDVVFDLDEILRFDGQTGPYVQYMYARICSILRKSNIESIDKFESSSYEYNKEEVNLIKLLDMFEEIIYMSAEEYEPSILTRYIIDVASAFSLYYNNNVILSDDLDTKKARINIAYATSVVIKKGLSMLGIECPNKM